MAYTPLGDGSYNWIGSVANIPRWFVKANPAGDDSAFLRTTYRTARALHDEGLTFINAPLPDLQGELRRHISSAWDLGVFPFIPGRSPDFHGSLHERAGIAHVIGRLHALAPVTTEALRWTPGYRRRELRELLEAGLDGPWDQGPFGDRARSLFRASVSGIRALLAEHDRLFELLMASPDPWVITHGEPHDGNSRLDPHGCIHLIDCDAMMLAPRERDLKLLLHAGHQRPLPVVNGPVLAAYRAAVAPVDVRPLVLELFRAEWHLMEISAYGQQFRGQHESTDGATAHWLSLNNYLPVSQNWPALTT